jgi:phage gp46-like protein
LVGGDLGTDRPIGSRLWLLRRAKQTDATAKRARDFIVEALQWLLDDGLATAIDVSTEWVRRGMLGAHVVIHRGSGTALSYSWAWQGID